MIKTHNESYHTVELRMATSATAVPAVSDDEEEESDSGLPIPRVGEPELCDVCDARDVWGV